MPDFRLEKDCLIRGYKSIAGIDEAGRGALCGPVTAASVIFPPEVIKNELNGWLTEIDDSKKLGEKKREKLARHILIQARAVGIGFASNIEIDKNNIFQATRMAMKRALAQMSIPPDFILIDGLDLDDVNYPQQKIKEGDRKSISIAAASIVAKVFRDSVMNKLNFFLEGYSWDCNKGYGTNAHYSALEKIGPSLIHRKSYKLRRK